LQNLDIENQLLIVVQSCNERDNKLKNKIIWQDIVACCI